jgi:hypothetical protein
MVIPLSLRYLCAHFAAEKGALQAPNTTFFDECGFSDLEMTLRILPPLALLLLYLCADI